MLGKGEVGGGVCTFTMAGKAGGGGERDGGGGGVSAEDECCVGLEAFSTLTVADEEAAGVGMSMNRR